MWETYKEIMGDNQQGNSQSDQNITENQSKMQIDALINSRIQEILENKEVTNARQFESVSSDQIGLKEALSLLPKSCDGRDTEHLDIFIEKCEFAMLFVVDTAALRLLQAIMTRLTGKARQVTRNRTFDNWYALREFLKANLEPQRTTQHLYLELYSSKQKKDEDVLTYSMRIEELQTLIIEQETAELSTEAAQAMEKSIKRQTKQVFMEGLGALKGFIKARNPPSLESAIQAAREEDKIKTSTEETKRLYHGTKSTPESNIVAKKTTGPCHICNKIGH